MYSRVGYSKKNTDRVDSAAEATSVNASETNQTDNTDARSNGK